jgi:hypothetical protein
MPRPIKKKILWLLIAVDDVTAMRQFKHKENFGRTKAKHIKVKPFQSLQMGTNFAALNKFQGNFHILMVLKRT